MSVQKQKHVSVVCTYSLPYPAPFFCQETQSNNKRNAVASSLPADKINTPNCNNNNNKHGGFDTPYELRGNFYAALLLVPEEKESCFLCLMCVKEKRKQPLESV